MATETLPDIEAWLQHEVEMPCEMLVLFGPCDAPADWVAHARFDGGCKPVTRFLCDRCKDEAAAGRTRCCPGHDAMARVTWIERSRGAH